MEPLVDETYTALRIAASLKACQAGAAVKQPMVRQVFLGAMSTE